jgi:hypothetical protein
MKHGSKIVGWWAWWPCHGEDYARRFETEEDARAYLPIKKGNKGRKLPLGPKVIARIGFGHLETDANHWGWWIRDVQTLTQEEVDDLFFALAAEAK